MLWTWSLLSPPSKQLLLFSTLPISGLISRPLNIQKSGATTPTLPSTYVCFIWNKQSPDTLKMLSLPTEPMLYSDQTSVHSSALLLFRLLTLKPVGDCSRTTYWMKSKIPEPTMSRKAAMMLSTYQHSCRSLPPKNRYIDQYHPTV